MENTAIKFSDLLALADLSETYLGALCWKCAFSSFKYGVLPFLGSFAS